MELESFVFHGIWEHLQVNKEGPENLRDFEFLQDRSKAAILQQAHVLCFCTQECTNTILKSFLCDEKKEWREKIVYEFRQNFEVIAEHSLNALHTIILVKKTMKKYCSGVNHSTYFVGGYGLLPNKAVVMTTLKFKDHRLLFMNCHLPHGVNNIKSRVKILNRVMQKVLEKRAWKQSDFIFFMGDFNFRVQLTLSDFRYLVDSKNILHIDKLLHYDELSVMKKKNLLVEEQNEMQSLQVLKRFQEQQIQFPPTYKFFGFTNTYKITKNRLPSYTDRILFFQKTNETILPINYGADFSLTQSDHKPIFAQFVLLVKQFQQILSFF